MQITSAMKMVSAAKLKKAQDAITAMRPYSNKLTELIQSLSANLDSEVGGAYAKQRCHFLKLQTMTRVQDCWLYHPLSSWRFLYQIMLFSRMQTYTVWCETYQWN